MFLDFIQKFVIFKMLWATRNKKPKKMWNILDREEMAETAKMVKKNNGSQKKC